MGARGPIKKIKQRNNQIEDILTKKGATDPFLSFAERNAIISEIAKDFDVSWSTVYAVFNKFRKALEETDEKFSICTKLDLIYLRTGDINEGEVIRVIERKDNEYFLFGQDLLNAVELQSSIYMDDLYTIEGVKRQNVKIQLDEGVQNVWVIPLSLAQRFLQQVAKKHTFIKVKESAQKVLRLTRRLTNHVPTALISREWDGQSGDIISFEVTTILAKRVFGKVVSDKKHPVNVGVHISQVTDAYVPNLKDYFEVGKTYKGTVLEYDDFYKRLELSTVLIYPTAKVPSKPNLGHINEEQKPIIQKVESKNEVEVETVTKEVELEKKADTEKVEPIIMKPKVENVSPITKDVSAAPVDKQEALLISSEFQNEVQQIIQYVSEQMDIGQFSPLAIAKLITLLKEEGLFKVSMGVSEVLKNPPSIDLGVLFLEEVKENLKETLENSSAS